MKCGRSKCQTPTDDVRQVKSVTLCRAHRMALRVPTLAETEQRVRMVANAKAPSDASEATKISGGGPEKTGESQE